MQARATFTHVATKVSRNTITPYTNNIRHYPGPYTCIDLKKTTTKGQQTVAIRTATNKVLPQHEGTHTWLKDEETGLFVAIFSSCKKETKGFKKVADTNFKGQKVDGTSNAKDKEQWMKMFDKLRFADEVAFLEQHKEIFDNLIEDSTVNTKKSSTCSRTSL